jgi:CHAD domain-containing protein
MTTETQVAATRPRADQLVDLGEPVVAKATDPPEHHVRAALDKRLRAMLKHDPGTRTGEDPEDLHQMRVSVRRMRAVLQAARPLLNREWANGLRAELGWLGRALGPVRDLDVLLMRLRGEAALFGSAEQADVERLLGSLEEERARARTVMVDALVSERYTALVNRLAEAVAQPVPKRGGKRKISLTSLVAKEFDRLNGAVDRAGDTPPDEVLHELRIHGKRLRYTVELTESALGPPAHELLRKTVVMQDVLGEHQDACVAQQRVTALLADLPSETAVAFVAGRLFEREEVRRLETRAAWPPAWAGVRQAAGRALQPN